MLAKRKKRNRSDDYIDQVLGVVWYDPGGWARMREITDDPEKLEETFEQWLEIAEKAVRNLRAKGATVERVTINVDEYVVWCNDRDHAINSSTRAQFVSYKLGQGHSGG